MGNPIQSALVNLTSESCLFNCYLFLGLKREPKLEETLRFLADALERDYIDTGCFVKNPNGVLLLTGRKATAHWASKNPGTWCVARFNNGKTNHFVVVDGNDNIVFNPLYYSNTVATGKIADYRVIEDVK